MLRRGFNFRKAASLLKPPMTPIGARKWADRWHLPLNVPVPPTSERAKNMQRLVTIGYEASTIGQLYRQTPARIVQFIEKGWLP